MGLDLYVFTSKTEENIKIGVEHRTWAIPRPESLKMRRQYTTKALKMPVGAHGVFYFSGRKWFTTPFIVGSKPDADEIVSDIWDGEFILPFRFHPLSEAWPWARKSFIQQLLPSVALLGSKWHLKLLVKPTEAFLPSEVSNRDWEALVNTLAPAPALHLV